MLAGEPRRLRARAVQFLVAQPQYPFEILDPGCALWRRFTRDNALQQRAIDIKQPIGVDVNTVRQPWRLAVGSQGQTIFGARETGRGFEMYITSPLEAQRRFVHRGVAQKRRAKQYTLTLRGDRGEILSKQPEKLFGGQFELVVLVGWGRSGE